MFLLSTLERSTLPPSPASCGQKSIGPQHGRAVSPTTREMESCVGRSGGGLGKKKRGSRLYLYMQRMYTFFFRLPSRTPVTGRALYCLTTLSHLLSICILYQVPPKWTTPPSLFSLCRSIETQSRCPATRDEGSPALLTGPANTPRVLECTGRQGEEKIIASHVIQAGQADYNIHYVFQY